MVWFYSKTCSSFRGKPTELESLRVRGGIGTSEAIKSWSVHRKSDRTYECNKYEGVEKKIRVSNDQHGPSTQEILIKDRAFLKWLITVVNEGGRCLVVPSHPPKNLTGDGLTDKGNNMANILVDSSCWY